MVAVANVTVVVLKVVWSSNRCCGSSSRSVVVEVGAVTAAEVVIIALMPIAEVVVSCLLEIICTLIGVFLNSFN